MHGTSPGIAPAPGQAVHVDPNQTTTREGHELNRLRGESERVQALHRFRSVEDPHCVEDDELWPCRTERARTGTLS